MTELPNHPGPWNWPKAEPLKIIYTNHRGETAERLIRPLSLWYGKTWYHPRSQWFIRGIDLVRCVERDFAVEDIGGKVTAPLPTINNERDLLNMVNIRAETREAITRAAVKFREPHVMAGVFEDRVVITITEGAVDAKAS